jgi:hypothetical protein
VAYREGCAPQRRHEHHQTCRHLDP